MLLLLDFLDQALAEPQCAWSWHRLYDLWGATQDQAARQEVLRRLLDSTLSDRRPEILRLTFLSGVTEDTRFFEQAAKHQLAIEPINPDRLAASMAISWLGALASQGTRESFVAALNRARLPELAARLGQMVTDLVPANLTVRVPRAIERVAIVAPYLGGPTHTPSVMVANQCQVLAKEGKRVHLFSCQELMPPEPALFFGAPFRLLLPTCDGQFWREALPLGVSLSISDTNFSLARRWCEMIPLLAHFDPDAILLVGLYSPLAAALYALRPVVGLNVHNLPPLAPLDLWLSAEEEAALAPPEKWGGVFGRPRGHFHPYRLKAPVGGRVTRAELGLAEEAVVWITVGFRLEREIAGLWAARMQELLARHPQVVWLLVGGEGKLPPSLASISPGRVLAIPSRPELGGILALADIYVNPPRMGGGFSVAEAMAVGLPVLAFAGSDGGDKVGELAIRETDDYLEQLVALTKSPGLRAEVGQALRLRFRQRFDLTFSGPSLLAALEKSAHLAQERLRGQGPGDCPHFRRTVPD